MIYLDCSSFVNAVYYEAFNENILPYDTLKKSTNTKNFVTYALENGTSPDVVSAIVVADYKNNQQVLKDLLATIKTNLKVSDAIIAESDDYEATIPQIRRVAFVYLGENQLVSCTTKYNGRTNLVEMSDDIYNKDNVLVTIFAYERYAVLRPSMA